MALPITLRCPTIYAPSPAASPPTFPPSLDQLLGQWHITLTSSPAWHGKRNVVLTYTLLSSATPTHPLLDDLITYQGFSSAKQQSVHGTDTPSSANPFAWTWRGNGWLKIAASHWEILGHGALPDDGGQWLVVHAQKSIFTPAVLNVYTRAKEGLPEDVRAGIEDALRELGIEDLRTLVGSMYSVPQD